MKVSKPVGSYYVSRKSGLATNKWEISDLKPMLERFEHD